MTKKTKPPVFETFSDSYYDKDLKIIESSSSEDSSVLADLFEGNFEPSENLDLKLRSQEAVKDSEIHDLVSYPLVKGNLEYNLPHQQEGALRILRDLDGRALLADEVGLGKTITAGMVLKECIVRGFINRALILAPPSLVNQWKSELKEKFNLDFTEVSNEWEWESTNYAIASIDKVKSFSTAKNEFKHKKSHEIYWDLIIIDEAHKLKNKKTHRWKFVDKLKKKRLLLLTATPFQNNLVELYNLLTLLKRGHLGTISEFRKFFLLKGDERRPLNHDILKRKLGEIMIRRRRDEAKGVEYKKRDPKIKKVKLSIQEKAVYDRMVKLLFSQYFNFKEKRISAVLAAHSILPKVTSSSRSSIEVLENLKDNPKYSRMTQVIAEDILHNYKQINQDTKVLSLIETIDDIIKKSPKEKMLIYTKHPTTLKYISELLQEKKLKVTEFHGGLTPDDKSTRIKEFEKDSQILISTDTGSEGLNLQFCSKIINYDLPWNPMAVEQRIGRLDRIGQKKDITIYNLATEGTMEEKIIDLIINKLCCIGLVIGELPTILFNLGLDTSGEGGSAKVEEKLMYALIDSKNNLSKFEDSVDDIGSEISKGIEEYVNAKRYTREVID